MVYLGQGTNAVLNFWGSSNSSFRGFNVCCTLAEGSMRIWIGSLQVSLFVIQDTIIFNHEQGYLKETNEQFSPGGLVWMGTPCQSWIVLSRSWTQRTSYRPEGPTTFRSSQQQKYLQRHNALAELTALIITTATALSIVYTIEQPASSLLFSYDAVKKALQLTKAKRISMWMARLAGESPKPLVLCGTGSFLDTFQEVNDQRKHCGKCAKRRLTEKSNGSFTGKARALKQSSGYTRCMGVAVALSYNGTPANQVLRELSSLGY